MSEGVRSMRIAVLGGGVMGETLASGFLRYVTPVPDGRHRGEARGAR